MVAICCLICGPLYHFEDIKRPTRSVHHLWSDVTKQCLHLSSQQVTTSCRENPSTIKAVNGKLYLSQSRIVCHKQAETLSRGTVFCETRPYRIHGNTCKGLPSITIGPINTLAILDFCGFHICGEDTRRNITHMTTLNIFCGSDDSS
jgi:hypothetical protein